MPPNRALPPNRLAKPLSKLYFNKCRKKCPPTASLTASPSYQLAKIRLSPAKSGQPLASHPSLPKVGPTLFHRSILISQKINAPCTRRRSATYPRHPPSRGRHRLPSPLVSRLPLPSAIAWTSPPQQRERGGEKLGNVSPSPLMTSVDHSHL